MSKIRIKLEPEERVGIIERYLNNEISCLEAAKEANVDPSTIARWTMLYENEGPTALFATQKNSHYPVALKLSAVTDYLNGEGSLNELAKKYKLRNQSQLLDWIKVYNTHGTFKSESGGSYMRKGRKTSVEERLAIVLDCLTENKNYAL
ncbi:hypothetical protein IGI37_001009 [Enterococcus sp. AZ194]|uniref:helix-turn-helix domain-containing protein n=1 Tax=Enterococcus sp. AZ194 TaxID=2774629 RepID=UPI003F1EC5C2